LEQRDPKIETKERPNVGASKLKESRKVLLAKATITILSSMEVIDSILLNDT
jgi:hypothetical protein